MPSVIIAYMNYDKKLVGSRLKELRTLAGLSQAQLAEKFGCSTVVISGYETGRVNLLLGVMLKYCDILRMNPADFMNFILGNTEYAISIATENPFFKKRAFLSKYMEKIRAILDQSNKRQQQLTAENLKLQLTIEAMINEIAWLSNSRHS